MSMFFNIHTSNPSNITRKKFSKNVTEELSKMARIKMQGLKIGKQISLKRQMRIMTKCYVIYLKLVAASFTSSIKTILSIKKV